MKQSKILSCGFAVAGMLLAACAVALSLTRLHADPVLVAVPDAAEQCAQALMDALERGNYGDAGEMMYGTPDLGVDRAASDEVGQMLWKAFTDSLEYEFSGEFYTTDSGVARDVTITTLDITSVTATLKERSQALLEHRVKKAEDVSQVYDENNEYREEFVMNVLFDAVYQSLREDARYTSQTVTLNLVYRQGQWWVMPDTALLAAISGGTAG